MCKDVMTDDCDCNWRRHESPSSQSRNDSGMRDSVRASVRHQDKPPRGHEIIAIHFLENAPIIERTWRDLNRMVAGEVTTRSCNYRLRDFRKCRIRLPRRASRGRVGDLDSSSGEPVVVFESSVASGLTGQLSTE